MTSRRKYKPRAYRSGGRVLDDTPIAEDVAPEPARSPPAASPTAADDNPLARAVAAQARAEALQWQAQQQPQPQQPQTLDEYIDALPLTEHKKHFLREHPQMLHPELAPIAAWHHGAALQAGIADDTQAMNDYVLSGVQREIEALQRPAQQPAPQQRPAPATPPPAPAQRRSIPMAAPVSRAVASATSGQRTADNTLTAEERDIARRSFTDPNMSNAQKEYLYLQNRNRYRQMRADGSYSDQGGG